MSWSSFQPNDAVGLPEAESLGDSWVPENCSSDDAVALAGAEILRHFRGIPLQFHSLASLRRLHECVEPWLLRACPALLKRFVRVLHCDAKRTPKANTVRIGNHEYVFLHEIRPWDWRTLEIRLHPSTDQFRWLPVPGRVQIPNITKVRLLVPSTLSGFNSDAALGIVRRTLEQGYTCVLDSLSVFAQRTPWASVASDLYTHLGACAQAELASTATLWKTSFSVPSLMVNVLYILSVPEKWIRSFIEWRLDRDPEHTHRCAWRSRLSAAICLSA